MSEQVSVELAAMIAAASRPRGGRFASHTGDSLGRAGTSGRQPTYYFSAAGSDANDGKTLATPKQTLTAFNALTLVATDYVVFRQGDTFSGTMTIPGGGSVLSRVIIGSYGIGANPIIAAAANTSGIVTTNLSYLTIQNLTITGSGSASTADGIQMNVTSGALTDITIDTCSASGFSHCGIYVNALVGSSNTLANLTIKNCTMNANATGVFNGGGGIFVRGPNGVQAGATYSFTNTLISNCAAFDNLGAAGTTFHTGNGILLTECNSGLITGCVAYNNGGNCNTASGGPGGIWTADSNAVVIDQCESYNNHTSNLDGNGFDMDGGCDNCTIQYCYSHGNDGGGLLSFSFAGTGLTGNTNNTIKFCVSSRDCQKSTTVMGGIYVTSAAGAPNTGLKIYGNTVFTSSPSANAAALKLVCPTGQAGGTIANNIFQTSSSAKLLDTATNTVTGFNITGNCWFPINSFNMSWSNTTYTSYATWQTATGLEKISGVNVGVNADPTISNIAYAGTKATSSASQKNSFKLASGSPCLGAGVNLQSQYSITAGGRDYYGKAVTDGGTYDIGCAFGAAVLGSTVTATFTDHAEDSTSQTTYTWAAKNFAIGTADATRLVVAVVTGRVAATTTATCSGVTIGGVAATLVTDGRNTGGSNLLTQSVWQALVPTGTTATVSATFSQAFLRSGVSVFSVTGSNGNVPLSTNVNNIASTDTGTADPSIATTISVPVQGAAIVCGAVGGLTSGTPSITPTNFTTDLAPTALGAATSSYHTAGHDATAGWRTYTQAWGGTGTNTPTGAFAAWMPSIS